MELGCRVNGNLNLSRAIGDLRYKGNEKLAAADQIISAQPDVREIQLTSLDWFLVLACDGVWDVMSNQVPNFAWCTHFPVADLDAGRPERSGLQEVVNFVGQRLNNGEAPASIASQLLDACLASDPAETRGIGCDNMTATIIVLHQHKPDLTAAQH